jgi:hypothetical protein
MDGFRNTPKRLVVVVKPTPNEPKTRGAPILLGASPYQVVEACNSCAENRNYTAHDN